MAATILGATYSPPSPLELHYADAASSIHPDRPIRPLPKRRLRSRIPSEVADSILYPPNTDSRPLFHSPYDETSRHVNGIHNGLPNGYSNGTQNMYEDESKSYQFRGNEIGSDDDTMASRRQEEEHRPVAVLSTKNGYTRNDGAKFAKLPLSQSMTPSNDSIDGYDSFENTNNKKKRKIPMSGTLGNHQSSLSAEMAQMGLSSTRDIDTSIVEADSGVGHYYGSGSSAIPTVSSGNGISGAGRGRYGRAGTKHYSGRSPLSVSINGSNSQNSRSLYPRRDTAAISGPGMKEMTSARAPDQGIISTAIANAAALPVTPVRGQENASLFEQQTSKKPSSTKTQFTFTCESDSSKTMVWPDAQSPLSRWDKDVAPAQKARVPQAQGGLAGQGLQKNANVTGQAGDAMSQQPGVIGQVPQQPRKPRRPLEKQYRIAARDRRLRQEYNNYHHPPKGDDIWICQFCEYESIFGEKPQHLIRQYEAKDRRERKRLAEKRRLLEKAKMKGKKGKKGNKGSKNSNPSAHPHHQDQKPRYDEQPLDELPTPNGMGQNEEYGLDADDEENLPLSMPQQTPSRIPQPISQNQHHSLRPPSGSGAMRQSALSGRDTYF